MNWFLIVYVISILASIAVAVASNYIDYKHHLTEYYELTLGSICSWVFVSFLPVVNTLMILVFVGGMIGDWVEEKQIFSRPLISRPAKYDYDTTNIRIEGNKIIPEGKQPVAWIGGRSFYSQEEIEEYMRRFKGPHA